MDTPKIYTIRDIMDEFGCETPDELEMFIQAYATLDELEELNHKLDEMRKTGEYDWLNPPDDKENSTSVENK